MSFSSKIKVAVLRGGPSVGYDTSLKTGEHVLSVLRNIPDTYEPLDIFISKDGEWHKEGLVHEPHQVLRYVDVVWNALHGSYGDDIQVQRVLEGLKIPFTGSNSVSSVLSMNKDMAKNVYQRHSLNTPLHELFLKDNLDEDKLVTVFRTYLHPVIVKPSNGVDSLGVRFAHTFHELKLAIKEAFKHSPKVLVEEFIKGDEVSCVVVEGARGHKLYAFLPVGKNKPVLKVEENKQIGEMAKCAHEMLGLRHYSGSDFIITPKRKIYILETNSLPAFYDGSLMHQSLGATGWKSHDFVKHVLGLAL